MRKTQTVTIDREGRDQGKTFLITEMPAVQAERWAMRAFFAMANAGVDLPDDVADAGMAALASFGLRALGAIRWEDAEPLLDEMMGCVAFVPDRAKPEQTRKLMDEDIEEVSTRLELRRAVWELHTGFFSGVESSTSAR